MKNNTESKTATRKYATIKVAALLMLAAICLTVFCSCGEPDIGEVDERFRTLLEESGEVNRILWGEGLPVVDYLAEYGEEYYNYIYEKIRYYTPVTEDCGYLTIEEIKAAAEKVYSKDYLEGGVYQMLFDGYSDETVGVITARYIMDDETDWLTKSNTWEAFYETQAEYDYSTMKIVRPSNAKSVTLEISAYGQHIDYETYTKVVDWHTVRLNFVKENGEWYLDSPSY